MKKRPPPEATFKCARKRRYASQGDALDATVVLGLSRERRAYLCPVCRHWHLTSAPR